MENRPVAESIANCILRHGGDPDGGTTADIFGVTGAGRRFEVVHGTLRRPLKYHSREAIMHGVQEGLAATRVKTLGQVRDYLASGWQVLVLGHGDVDAITNDGGVQMDDDWHPWTVLRGRLVYAVKRFEPKGG
jgi:hypothetical protein